MLIQTFHVIIEKGVPRLSLKLSPHGAPALSSVISGCAKGYVRSLKGGSLNGQRRRKWVKPVGTELSVKLNTGHAGDLVYNGLDSDASFEVLWRLICLSLIDGEETSQYLIECLP